MALNTYNQTYNFDNSMLRYIIVALLAELRDHIYIYQHLDDGTTEKVDVPFLYSITGGERFLKDEFFYDSLANGKAIGDYEHVPRCMLQLDSIGIDSSSQTNKFIPARFVREVDGVLRTFVMRCCFLPLNMSFSVTGICSSMIEMLKLTESVMSKCYTATTFYVDLGMMNVQAAYVVPADYGQNRTTEYSLNDKKEFEVTFSIEVKTFMPVFEHGLLLDEIDEMAREAGEGSIIQLRADKYGNVGLRSGGIIGEFDMNLSFDAYPKMDLLSNRDPKLKEKDYVIKPAGYGEKQNIDRSV